jgi:hypothetical protein
MNSKKRREIGLITREAFDVDVTRLEQEKLHPHGHDSVVDSIDDGITRFLIRVRGGEIRIQSRTEFLPILQLVKKMGV